MMILGKNPHYAVEQWTGTPVVRVKRTSHAGTAEQMRNDLREVILALDELNRPSSVLLLDLRDGPFRSGDEHDDATAQLRRRLFKGFQRIAVLTSTSVGRLQVSRMAQGTGAQLGFFEDEAAALTYLAKGPSSRG